MLTKHNVCLYIKDEERLEEMREFLHEKGELIDEISFYFSVNDYNYLQIWKNGKWIMDDNQRLTEITTEQFKKLWE